MARFRRTRSTFRKKVRKGRRSMKRKVSRIGRVVKRMAAASYTYQPTVQLSGQANGFMTSAHNQTGTSVSNGKVALTVIPAGAGESSRLGNTIFLRRLYIRGYTFQSVPSDPNIAGDLPLGRILIWLVRDNDGESLGSAGSNTDLTSIWQNLGTQNQILPYLRPEMRGKIKVLADIKINLLSTNVMGSSFSHQGRIVQWSRSINLAKHCKGPTTYTGSVGDPLEQEKNHVYIAFLQIAPVTLQGSMISNWMHRLTFFQ